MPNLGLNEALLVINKGKISGQIDLFHQVEECYGCPLVPLRAADEEPQNYVLNVKHNVRLELRQAATNGSCQLNDLNLNSQGQYRIDIGPPNGDNDQTLDCKLKTLDYGECLLCPFAILICFLFALMAFEQAYTKFWPLKRFSNQKSRPETPDKDGDKSTPTSVEVGNGLQGVANPVGQQQLEVASLPTTSKTSVVVLHPAPMSTLAPALQGVVVSQQPRIECLDVFRGLTLAGMIFVNYGGAGYAIWDHKPWNGITLADFVFPFFIFSMGASIAISIKSLVKRHRKSFNEIAIKIFKRSIILMLLGVFLNSKAVNHDQSDGLTRLRLTGVLQRFSISYLVIAFMYTIELMLNKWARATSIARVPYLSKLTGVIFELLTALNYTAIYIYFTFYFDYDSTGNCPMGYTGPGGQTAGGQYASCTGGAAAWIDRWLIGTSHLYNDHEVKEIFRTQVTHDPEGLLGSTTSIILTLIGLQCGKILTGKQTPKQRLLSLARWVIALTISCSLVVLIPINKRLWSLTFVLVTALAAILVVMAFYVLIDIYSSKRVFLFRLLSSAGKNSIFLYVGHSLVYGLLPWWFPVGDPASHMQLLFRLTWSTLMWLLVAHYMALKKLFIKI